jgi:transcriptional regulator with XRE-family HTH domain
MSGAGKIAATKLGRNDPLRNDETVARNLRHFRIARGLSQTALGDAVGVTFQQIQKYEKGMNSVAPGRLRQICEVLGVAPGEMFGRQPEIGSEPIPKITSWSYRTLIALNKIRSDRVRRSIDALIEELVDSQ